MRVLYLLRRRLDYELLLVQNIVLVWQYEIPQLVDGQPVRRVQLHQIPNQTLEDLRVPLAFSPRPPLLPEGLFHEHPFALVINRRERLEDASD